jgi:hypothetical protein
MNQKAVLLGRGMQVNSDWAHELGTATIPGIPDRLKSQAPAINADTGNTQREAQEEPAVEECTEEKLALRDRIEGLTIPSILGARILLLATTLLFMVVPVIVMLVWCDRYLSEVKEPIESLGLLAKPQL